MRQKEIIGSHFANAWECNKANELIEQRPDPPGAVADDALRGRRQGPPAHAREQAPRQDRDPRRRRPRRARARPPRAPARSARRSAPDGRRRPHPLVRDGLPRRQARGGAGGDRAGRAALRRDELPRSTATATTATSSCRSPTFERQGRLGALLGRARSSSTSASITARAGTRCRSSTAGPTSSPRARWPRSRWSSLPSAVPRAASPAVTSPAEPALRPRRVPSAPGARSMSIRSRASDWRMRRETCICETPIRREISVCVRSSSKRRRRTSRSRVGEDVERAVEQHAHLGAAELGVGAAERVGERDVLAGRLVERARAAGARRSGSSPGPPRTARRSRRRAPARSASGRARSSACRAPWRPGAAAPAVPRGTRIAHVLSRKWRLISPSTVGVA